MSESTGKKRKAGFVPKLIGTVAWGLVLGVAAYFWLPASFLGIEKPPLATFFLIGLGWPLVWLMFWLLRVALPRPFEYLPRLIELFLVGPGHLAAWVAFGKTEDAKPAAPTPPKAEA